MRDLAIDTETSGLCLWDKQSEDPNQPRLVEVAAVLRHDGRVQNVFNVIIKPEGWIIPDEAAKIHGITTEIALKVGVKLHFVALMLEELVNQADVIICHNVKFDVKMLKITAHHATRPHLRAAVEATKTYCTMDKMTPVMKIAGPRGHKWPKLSEAYQYCFGEGFGGAHRALADVKACLRVYDWLKGQEAA